VGRSQGLRGSSLRGPGRSWSRKAKHSSREGLLIMRSKGIARNAACLVALAALGGSQPGCTSWLSTWRVPSVSRIFAPSPVLPNPLVVPSSDFEKVWNETVAVVNKYFPIASENRLARTIRTDIQMSGTLVEPWSSDSATFRDRLEATLQTTR